MSRATNFDRGRSVARAQRIWPIDPRLIIRYGESVLEHRRGTSEKHEGIDIFAVAGTLVRAAAAGRIVQVKDGRFSKREHLRRAGLFVDVLGSDGLMYRYLHLGITVVSENQIVRLGENIGDVAPAHTSGLGDETHLHFEIRNGGIKDHKYAPPIDPLTLLPRLAA